MTLTPEQLHILQHSLGCDKHGRTEYRGRDEGDGCGVYGRNRYVSDPRPDLIALVAAGLMEDRGPQTMCGGMHWYVVTEAGVRAMREQSPVPPRLTTGQRRYREWLKADCGLSFGEWLKVRKAYERDTRMTGLTV
jgi:hypothetical protein